MPAKCVETDRPLRAAGEGWPGPPATTARQWAVVAVLCASQLMVVLDGSIVAVALPAIRRGLGFSGSGIAWVVNAYLIAFGGLLLLAGRIGEAVGPRRLLVSGLVVFTAGSTACALAPTAAVLVVARFVQGIGAAAASAVTLGIIVALFPEGDGRRKALGAYTFAGAAGSSIGFLAGGVLTDLLDWRWIFIVTVPVGVAGAVATGRLLPLIAPSRSRPALAPGLTVTAALMLVVYVLLGVGGPASATRQVSLAGVAAVLVGGFLVGQHRATDPLLPLALLRSRVVGMANLVQALLVAALFGFQFLGVVYLQQTLRLSPLQAGLAYLPVALVIAVSSLLVSPRLLPRLGTRGTLLVGLGLVTLGLALLVRLPASGHLVLDLLPSGLLIAVGFGLAYPAIAGLAVGGAPPEYGGIASGLFNAVAQIGGALGYAVQAALAAGSTGSIARSTGAVAGYHHAFAAATACAACAAVCAVLATAPGRVRTTAAP